MYLNTMKNLEKGMYVRTVVCVIVIFVITDSYIWLRQVC